MKSSAFIVGADCARDTELSELAGGAGFAPVAPFSSMSAVEAALARIPLAFFLFAPVPDIAMLSGIVQPLRACKRRDVRFMPLIYFCEIASREVIRGCMALGFDDVIALPVAPESFKARLKRQLDTPFTYRAAEEYFGPARDRGERAAEGGGQSVRFVRATQTGITLSEAGSSAA